MCFSLNKPSSTSLWLDLEFCPVQSQEPTLGGHPRNSDVTWDVTALLSSILSCNRMLVYQHQAAKPEFRARWNEVGGRERTCVGEDITCILFFWAQWNCRGSESFFFQPMPWWWREGSIIRAHGRALPKEREREREKVAQSSDSLLPHSHTNELTKSQPLTAQVGEMNTSSAPLAISDTGTSECPLQKNLHRGTSEVDSNLKLESNFWTAILAHSKPCGGEEACNSGVRREMESNLYFPAQCYMISGSLRLFIYRMG